VEGVIQQQAREEAGGGGAREMRPRSSQQQLHQADIDQGAQQAAGDEQPNWREWRSVAAWRAEQANFLCSGRRGTEAMSFARKASTSCTPMIIGSAARP
jgi:hypothetical protein